MTEQRNATLESLFDASKQDFAGDEFVERVINRTDRLRIFVMAGWAAVGIVLIAVAWVLGLALQDAVDVINRSLSISLIDIGDAWLAPILSPVNSVAGVLAIGLLALRRIVRRIRS